jgi:hypothetical protein
MANRTPRIAAPSGVWQLERGHPLNEGLTAYYPLNENGGLTANDLSGRYRPGRLQGGAVWNNQGLAFDGIDDFVSMGTGDIITSASMTVSAWVWLPTVAAPGTYIPLVAKWDAGAIKRGWLLSGNLGGTPQGSIGFGVSVDGNTSLVDTTNAGLLLAKTWMHVAGVWKAGTNKIYFNGAPVPTTLAVNTGSAGVPFSSNAINTIGAAVSLGGGAVYLTGRLRSVRLYNRALTAQDIRALATHEYAGLVMTPRRMIAPVTGVVPPATKNSAFLTF